MNYRFWMLILFLGLSLGIFANATWSWLPSYNNVYNVTVNNWNYTATYGTSNVFLAAKTVYALVNLSNIGDPLSVSIVGYRNLQPVGAITAYLVQQNGANVILLLSNKTITNQTWNLASIYYFPLGSALQGNVSGTLNSSTNIVQSKFITYEIIGKMAKNLNINPTTFSVSNGTNSTITFTLNTSANQAFVVLSNKNLTKIGFNLTWSPNFANSFAIFANSITHNYILADTGLLGTSVSNTPLVSNNANFIFGISPIFDGLGFEAYLNSCPLIPINCVPGTQEIITEGMYGNSGGNFFNSTVKKGYGLGQLTGAQYFSLTINGLAKPLEILILPAFTKNVIISGSATNPNPLISLNTTFRYNQPVININWTYNFTTYALPTNAGVKNTLIFGAGNVSYLYLKLPHYPQMNGYCQSLYPVGYNKVNNISLGAIPFYIQNCTPNSRYAYVLFYNTTSLGDTYNAMNIYFNSTVGYTANSNYALFNNWQFLTGNHLIIGASNVPYLILLNNTLNSNSVVRSIQQNPTAYEGIQYNGIYYAIIRSGSTIVKIPDWAGYFPKLFLVEFNSYLISRDLTVTTNINGALLTNTSTAVQAGFALPLVNANISVTKNNAIAEKLYTQQGVLLNISYLYGSNNANNSTQQLPLPQSNYSLNYTHTTTISINSISQNVYVYPNVGFPEYLLVILSLILILIGAVTFEATKDGGFGFIFILIAIWILGILQIEILVLALILSVLFVIWEFAKHPEYLGF